LLLLLFVPDYLDLRYLHSFPTRRSSDLMFDKITYPFFTAATLVSSQLDSKAKIILSFLSIILHLKFYIINKRTFLLHLREYEYNNLLRYLLDQNTFEHRMISQ